MRKLIVILNTMIARRQKWDPGLSVLDRRGRPCALGLRPSACWLAMLSLDLDQRDLAVLSIMAVCLGATHLGDRRC
jgi:hypothetical protein